MYQCRQRGGSNCRGIGVTNVESERRPVISISAAAPSLSPPLPRRVKTILAYPTAVGRNFDELLRIIDALQLAAKYPIATPVNCEWPSTCTGRTRSFETDHELVDAETRRPCLTHAHTARCPSSLLLNCRAGQKGGKVMIQPSCSNEDAQAKVGAFETATLPSGKSYVRMAESAHLSV